MSKRIIACLLVSVILILCLPLSGVAAIIKEEEMLIEKFSAKLNFEGRIEGEIVVYMADNVSADEAYATLYDVCASSYNTTNEAFIASKITFKPSRKTQRITVEDSDVLDSMIALAKSKKFSAIDTNCEAKLADDYDPGTVTIGSTEYTQWHLDKIGVSDAWSTGFVGSSSTIVAVIDSGYTAHSELSSNVDMSLAINVKDDSSNVADDHWYGHGTFVAGIIGAALNGEGTNGICQNVRIAPIKAWDANTGIDIYDITNGVEAATAMGASVINASVDILYGDTDSSEERQASFDSLCKAIDDFGKLVIFAAGNNENIGSKQEIKSGNPKANNEELWVIVGGSTPTDTKRWSSCYSATYVDLFAPGEDIISTTIGSALYRNDSGTSFAAPMVTAAVAIIMSKATHLTPTEVKDIILDNVDVCTSLEGYCVTGGRLNIYNAVVAVYNENRGVYTCGDVNGDGYITSEDNTVMNQIIMGSITPTAQQRAAADINGDGLVNAIDYTYIRRYNLKTMYFIP